MKKLVMIPCSHYKRFHDSMENVSMIKLAKSIHDVYVRLTLIYHLKIISCDYFVDELAGVMKTCINRMIGLDAKEARYYCGYTLMKYCAVHVGLDRFPLILN